MGPETEKVLGNKLHIRLKVSTMFQKTPQLFNILYNYIMIS